MAAKKNAKKKTKPSRKKPVSVKKSATKRKTANRPAKKKQIKKKVSSGKKVIARSAASKTRRGSTKRVRENRVRENEEIIDTLRPGFKRSSAPSGRDAGDLQGLSNVEGADSESVDELLDEGNAFEADAVRGVEEAENADESEVHTHEVPEDDVPGEYLDKD